MCYLKKLRQELRSGTKFFLVFPLWLLIESCDAKLIMAYRVENRSKEEIRLFIPNYPVDSIPKQYGQTSDTVLAIMPGFAINVGFASKLDFPWATKNIYRKSPGVCGIKRLKGKEIVSFGCTKSEWKYRKGASVLKIK